MASRRSSRRAPASRLGRALPSSLVAVLLTTASAHAEAPPRWPTWPTEVRQVAAPLARDAQGKAKGDERARIAAIQRLDRFATGAILAPLVHALSDPSPQVQREALRMCFEREVVACVPGAASLWVADGEPTVRVSALKVLALDPDPSRAAILIDALRDPSEVIRIQAADFLGNAPLPPELRKRARTALLAKLADVSITVRRRAVLSLGLLGPGEGTLSIARLLDDPEPAVRVAAAEALGRYRDVAAVPALRRALASPNEASVSLALIEALAVLPDPEVDQDLLALVDDPPTGIDPLQIAIAIGRRPDPTPLLIEGLVARLHEPERQPAALHALLMLGEPTRGPLQAARDRGLAPSIEVEVERLLAALDPDDASGAVVATWPDDDDRPAWRERLTTGDPVQRTRAAWALAQRDPAWRVPAAVSRLAAPGPLAGRRPWALTLAASPTPWQAEDDDTTRARLEGWARDRGLAVEDRCLALAALGARAAAPGRRGTASWSDLAGDPNADVRACAALALGRRRDADTLAGLLVDPHGRVRTAAALALATLPLDELDDPTVARLTVLALRDEQPSVRAAASLALAASETPRTAGPGMFLRLAEPYPWAFPSDDVVVTLGERSLWLPTVGRRGWRWALVPGLAAARGADEAVETLEPADPAARSAP